MRQIVELKLFILVIRKTILVRQIKLIVIVGILVLEIQVLQMVLQVGQETLVVKHKVDF